MSYLADALRAERDGLAEILKEAQSINAEGASTIEAARQKSDRLDLLLASAPSVALARVREAAWDECLDAIEQNELNTAQAREGNPYRADALTMEPKQEGGK